MKKITLLILLAVMPTLSLAEITDAKAKQSITHFYNSFVLGGYGASSVKKFGTPRFLAKLKSAYTEEYDCDDGECYATFALRTAAQDGNGASKVVSITPRSGGWYRVQYRDMGFKGTTDVKLVERNGKILFDDYKRVFDGSY